MKSTSNSTKAILLSLLLCLSGQVDAMELTYTVTTTADSGGSADEGSLRNGIDQVNLELKNVIAFNISGDAPHVIAPETQLPTVEKRVDINGLSQADIVLDGSNLENSDVALKFSGADGSSVKGLTIINFLDNPHHGRGAIRLVDTSGMVIARNHIADCAVGVRVLTGSHNLIGGSSDDANHFVNNRVDVQIVDPAEGNSILSNEYRNSKNPIDLTTFVENEDCTDPDKGGANRDQCHPVLQCIKVLPTSLLVAGRLVSPSDERYLIQVYSLENLENRRENKELIGSFNVETNEDGIAKFTRVIPIDRTVEKVCANVTRCETGDTSEFSQPVKVNCH